MTGDITAAPEGTTFEVRGETLTVGPKCDENMGVWFCITHGKAYLNGMSKDGHISDGADHVMTWGCNSHGPEVP